MIRLSAVCRANEVRSRLIEGYINSYHSGFENCSFGIDVSGEVRNISLLNSIMTSWGIEYEVNRTRSCSQNLDYLKSSKLVIAADAAIQEYLLELGLNSINLTQFAVDSLHIPQDPIGFDSRDFAINSAKVVHCAARLIAAHFNESPNRYRVTALIPGSHAKNIDFGLSCYVIDARLRSVGQKISHDEAPVIFSQKAIQDGSVKEHISPGRHFYSPSFEFNNPERTLLSKNWREFVQGIAILGPTCVITAPQNELIWDSYLTSILADVTEYI